MGLQTPGIFSFQQGFWGKRYLGPEYQAKYGYGTVADLGVVLDYEINDILEIDLSLMNGEGYTNIQVDNSLKSSIGITATTPGHFVFRIYTDIIRPQGVWQSTFIAFAGYKDDKISIGGEASYKSNLDLIPGHNVWGISATGSYFLNETSEIFARYDYATSVILPGERLQWDYNIDGSYLITGFQHSLTSNLKLALNYRRIMPYLNEVHATDAIYLNAHFKF